MPVDSNQSFTAHAYNGLTVLKSNFFASIPWLAHGFSTRAGGKSEFPLGSLNLGFMGRDSRAAVESNRRAFFEALHVSGFSPARLRQTHSDRVGVIESREQLDEIILADAVITRTPGMVLTVLVADCVPILVVDVASRAIAAIHAGWRGTAAHIVSKTIPILLKQAEGKPGELFAAIGPSIRVCCYEVGAELLEAFENETPGARRYFSPGRQAVGAMEYSKPSAKERLHLDLAAANRDQLISAGVPEENISIHPDCTRCHPEVYFSHRGESGSTGRMMAAIALREGLPI